MLPIVPIKQADNSNCELCSENQTEKENETTPTPRSSSFPPKKRGQYKLYSLDFKLAVVRELYKSDASVSDMARKYNLPHSTINSWESELRQKNKKVSIHKKGVHLRGRVASLIKAYNPSFKASKGWLSKFMLHNGLSMRLKTSIRSYQLNLKSTLSHFLPE